MTFRVLVTVVFIVAAGLATRLWAQGYAPQEAVKHITVAEGLKATVFASEPEVRQAIFVKCDPRGRLWTIQYLQYPNPAGLQRVKVDRWSRTVYDRVPEPPPRGPRGADRITILTDTDGDGRADQFKDFVDGLNLVTGVEFGYGGVFVLNPPYLLFYPDANHDDVPDGDPRVLLSGFGMEDAQAMSSHLTWGPDGWLYGVNGSTTTCHIQGYEFQQGVWRYHPVSHAFELFCEGGSNCYGLTFDANGQLYYSTNGGPFVHAEQGAYYYKSFGKHGPLHNLFAYGYFPELDHDQVPGGPPTGGTVYLADAFPKSLRNTFIAGNFLGHTVSSWKVEPVGSTVRARLNGTVFDAHDTWCGPTDVCLSPDGSLYVSDFFDQRTAHPDPDANWDRSNGRIYKISAVDAKPADAIDISHLTSHQLVSLLSHPNHWYAYRARAELAERRDASVVAELKNIIAATADNRLLLEALWALHVTSGIDDELALRLLDHPYPFVRYWATRLIGDRKAAPPALVKQFVRMAASEPSAVVRGQLAATARRLPASDGLQIVASLLNGFPQENDPRVPLLIWWAIESRTMSDTDLVIKTFCNDTMWHNPAARENNLRLVRRYAAEGSPAGYAACARMLNLVPAEFRAAAIDQLRVGLAERAVGLQTIGQGGFLTGQAADADDAKPERRSFQPIDGELKELIQNAWTTGPRDAQHIELALRGGVDEAHSALTALAFGSDVDEKQRVDAIGLLREFSGSDDALALLKLIDGKSSDAVKLAVLGVVASFDRPEIAQTLITAYPRLTPPLQQRVRDVLFERPNSAVAFLQLVDGSKIDCNSVPVDQLRRLALLKHPEIDELVRKHWGNIGPGSAEEKLATIRRLNNDLRAGTGDIVAGKVVFQKTCGICHQLNGEGNKIGPDLTIANRADRMALLGNIVDPSAVIRREFLNYIVVTTSGRVVTGVICDQDGASITVVDANNQRTKMRRDEIDELKVAETSLMPERVLDPLTPQQLRDLFAYLQDKAVPQKGN